jgi:hypothetical protein
VTARSLCACCILLLVRPAAGDDAAADRLEFAAEPPVVAVPATTPGRRFIDLPALEYRFEVQAACTGNRTPRSLSISVADSRVALAGAAINADAAGELVLTVPARQLAPIAVDDFCVAAPVAGETAAEESEAASSFIAASAPPHLLTVPAVVSAQASLVCGDDAGSSIRYVTKPLAVTLACAAGDGTEAGKQGGGPTAR